MTRDFHLPGRSPVDCRRRHGGDVASAWRPRRRSKRCMRAARQPMRPSPRWRSLCVVEPHMTGIGGDCFCLVARPDAPVWGYNGSGRAASRVTTETLLEQGIRAIGPDSIHAVTVPGAIEAWAAILSLHGRFGLDRALQPAIRYAQDGFPVGSPRRLRLGAGGRPPRRRSGRRAALSVRRRRPGGRRRDPLSGARRDAADDRPARSRAPSMTGRSPTTSPPRFGRAAAFSRPTISRPITATWSSRSPPIIAVSTWSSCRRTGRASPRWCCSTFSNGSISRRSIRSVPTAIT